jgi:hypothetical protein
MEDKDMLAENFRKLGKERTAARRNSAAYQANSDEVW